MSPPLFNDGPSFWGILKTALGIGNQWVKFLVDVMKKFHGV
jgi:hypothetical protein